MAGELCRYTYHLSIEHPWWQILSPPPSKSSTLGSSIRERVCPFLLRRRFPSAAYMLNYRPVAGTVPSRVHSDSCTQICQQPFRTTLRCAFLDGGRNNFSGVPQTSMSNLALLQPLHYRVDKAAHLVIVAALQRGVGQQHGCACCSQPDQRNSQHVSRDAQPKHLGGRWNA